MGGLVLGWWIFVAPMMDGIYNSDRPPLEGRAQHAKDLLDEAKLRADEAKADDENHKAVAATLQAVQTGLGALNAAQAQNNAERQTAQLRILQDALTTATAIRDKDPTIANQKVVEALQSQLMALQAQVTK